MKLHISKPILLTGVTVLALAATAGAAVVLPNPEPTRNRAQTAQKQAAPSPKIATTSDSDIPKPDDSAKNPETQTSTPKPSDNTKAAASANSACRALTLTAAQHVLGTNAQTSTPQATPELETPDTTLATCAYISSTGNVRLVIRTPNNALGVSKNATVFGSEKPMGAITLQGYGQAAYWDPDSQQLNILSHNTWYIITRSGGSQADAEAVAKLLVVKW